MDRYLIYLDSWLTAPSTRPQLTNTQQDIDSHLNHGRYKTWQDRSDVKHHEDDKPVPNNNPLPAQYSRLSQPGDVDNHLWKHLAVSIAEHA